MEQQPLSADDFATPGEPEPPYVAELRRRQSLVLALAAGVVTGVIFAFLWGGITGITGLHVELVWLPMLGMGLLVGRAMAMAGCGIDLRFGIAGAVCTLLASFAGYVFAVVITAAWQLELASNLDFAGMVDGATLGRLVLASLSWADVVCFAIAMYEGFRLSRLPVAPASLNGLELRWSWKLIAVMVLVFPACVFLTWLSVSRYAVSDLAVAAGDRLAVCRTTRDSHGVIELWDLARGQEIARLADPAQEMLRMAVAHQADLLIAARRERDDPQPGQGVRSYGAISLWDTTNGAQRGQLQQRTDLFGHFRFAPGDQELIVANRSRQAEVWNIARDAVARQLEVGSTIRRLGVSPVGDLVAIATDAGEIHLWDHRQGQKVRTLPVLIRAVSDVAFSPDGKHLAVTAALAPEVTIWEVAGGKLLRTLATDQVWLTSARFSPDGELLAVAGGSFHAAGQVELWHTAGWQKGAVYSVLTSTVRAVAFSRDGSQLIAGSGQSCRLSGLHRTGRVHRWKLATGEELAGIE